MIGPLIWILGGVLAALGAAAIFVLLWDRYRDKIREWNINNNADKSVLSRAVVHLDKFVTNVRATVLVRRRHSSRDVTVYKETLSDEQVKALRDERPDLFEHVEQGGTVDVDIMETL